MAKLARPLRIAVLEADRPLTHTAAKYGTYGGVFTALLNAAATSLGWDPAARLSITKWDIEHHQHFPPSLDDLDAVLITGSRYSAFDNTPWIVALVDYIKPILTSQARVRLIGVCFGHQVIARALGATVERGVGWEASVCQVTMSARGEELFGKDTLDIFQMHRDIVVDLPEGAENLGSTERCQVQGMYASGRFISIQGHPEFTEEILSELLKVRTEAGIITQAEFKDMIGRVGREQDGIMIAVTFLKFVEEGVE